MDKDHLDGFGSVERRIKQKRHDIRLKELDLEAARLQRILQHILTATGEEVVSLPTYIDSRKTDPDYATLVRLAEHGQTNKWQTLQMFLLFQSLLFVGWTNLFRGMVADRAAAARAIPDKTILVHSWIAQFILLFLIAALGFLTAMIWGWIAPDYSRASKLYSDKAEKFEERFEEGMRTLTERRVQIDRKKEKWYGKYATSAFILENVPRALRLFWTGLSIAVIWFFFSN